MEKVLLIIGNMTFLNPQFDNETKAIVHSIDCVVECSSEDEASKIAEEGLENRTVESYLIPSAYNHEIVYECENNNLPISVEDYKKEFIN